MKDLDLDLVKDLDLDLVKDFHSCTLVTRDAFLKIFAKRCVCRRDLEGKLMVLTIALRPIFGVLLLIKIFPVALQLLIFWQGHDAHLRRAVGIT